MTPTLRATPERLPIERRVRVRQPDGVLSVPEPISHFSAVHAWVLIGNPGAGKTEVFKERSAAEGGIYITARNFVDLEPPSVALLFIDGLDEIAAGNALGFTALGQIRTKLQRMGTPKFRISCREADWRGSTDSEALQHLVGEKDFLELHLEPLNSQEIEELIAHWQFSSAQQAADFIKEAEKHGLDGLLDNPQTLRMLVEATASGWPANKTQTYQMACAKLVREHNDQWLAVTREDAHPDEALLQAASYLCSLMLLSGGVSLSLQRAGNNQKDVLSLPELRSYESAPDIGLCRAVLHTRLFRGNGSGEFFPVHRTVAEYLAAQYIAKRINAGLPSKRVLALMLGEDAGVVPELRGLHAWLAATATGDLRIELIDRDPLGVILNGDVRSFTRPEKLRVLDALSNEAKRYTYFRSQNWVSQPFGALATADMQEDFRSLLLSRERSPAHLALVDCVLDALANGENMPALNGALEQVVRDASYWPSSRIEALGVLIALERGRDQWSISLQLLDEIHSGKIEDSEDELLGVLLSTLYPNAISPEKLWNYLRQPKSGVLLGSYWRFWHDLSQHDTSIEDVATLLDSLPSSLHKLDDQDDNIGTARIIGSLLARGIAERGHQLETPHLFRWLSLGLGQHYHSPLELEHKEVLRRWLEENPDRYKELFEYGLQRQADAGTSGWGQIWQTEQYLYEAPKPPDTEHWYLSLATATDDPDLRRELVLGAFRIVEKKKNVGSAIELLENWRHSHSTDIVWIDAFLQCPYPPENQDQERIDSKIKRETRLQEREKQKIEFFQGKLAGFAQGIFDLGALVEIGNAYLNYSHRSSQKTPEARIRELLNQKEDWVHLALHGLRQCLFRTDLPTAEEIIELHARGRRYNLAMPCLAAMDLHWTENPASILSLPKPVLETVVAFRLVHNYDATPDWFKSMVGIHPEILANVMIPLISMQIATKQEYVYGLYPLAHDPSYSAIAKIVTPEILNRFPLKTSKKQLESLRLLIISVINNLNRPTQLKIVADKLGGKPSDVAQRVYWFTAALQIAPDVYLEPAKQYIAQTQPRISHLIALVHAQRDRNSPKLILPVSALEFLIGILGPRCTPSWPNQSGWVSPAMELGRYVEGLISTLAGIHEDAAKKSLTTLLQDKNLKAWGDALRRAIFDQRLTRRKALFQPASVTQVTSTLANLEPANAADLWALTLDHLQQLAHEIRNGNTNDYRQYWAGEKAEIEDNCRDRLLSDLKIRLAPLGINAEPEGRYADEKRADIKVSAQGYNIPIEIKREMHRDLWSAISNQLIARYTRELASDGYGIFLVFWFGGAGQPVAGDGGTRPKTAVELQERLQRTVAAGYEHKIAVLVVDCSLRPVSKAK